MDKSCPFKENRKTWNIKTNSSEEERNLSVYKHEKGKDGISLHDNKKLAIKNLNAQKNCTFIHSKKLRHEWASHEKGNVR